MKFYSGLGHGRLLGRADGRSRTFGLNYLRLLRDGSAGLAALFSQSIQNVSYNLGVI